MRNLLNSQTKTITLSALIVGISIFLSRILGLLRDRLLAGKFGAGESLDIYFAAFRIPDFVYGILIAGGISSVFLPVFSQYYQKQKEKGWELANNTLNSFLVLTILLCLILAIFTPLLVNFLTPGFTKSQKSEVCFLTRILFLSPILFGISSIFSGILHYFKKFLAYSLAPIFYNLGIIFGILCLGPFFGIKGVVYGVILGAVLHFLIQLPPVKFSGFRYKFFFDLKDEGLRKIFKLALPRTIGAGVYHLNLIILTSLASTLTAGSIAVFNFANNLQYFPIGLIGASFAIAAFPNLSQLWVNGMREKFVKDFSQTLRQILFLIVPCSFLFFLLRAQIVRLILGTGKFDWQDTKLTAGVLGVFCLGMVAFGLIPFLVRAFYSLHNTKTPTIIGVLSVVLNIILAIFFIYILKNSSEIREIFEEILKLENVKGIEVVGLALSLCLSAIFQALFLFFLFQKKVQINTHQILLSFLKIIFASMGGFFGGYLVLNLASIFVNMKTFFGVFAQAFLGFLGFLIVFLIIGFILKLKELKLVKNSLIWRSWH